MELIHGNCLEVMNNIPNKSIDLIVTDPPYLHVKGGQKSKKYNVGTWSSNSYTNKEMSDFDEKHIVNFLNLANEKMKKTNMYIFCSKLQLAYYFKWIYENKKKYDLLVWNKQRCVLKSTKCYSNDMEYVIRIYENGVSLNKIWVEDGSKADSSFYTKIQSYPQPKGKHENMKPVELLTKYILLSSDEGDIVCDPFMGSGSTGEACIRTNRRFIGIELKNDFYNVAIKRLEKIRTVC